MLLFPAMVDRSVEVTTGEKCSNSLHSSQFRSTTIPSSRQPSLEQQLTDRSSTSHPACSARPLMFGVRLSPPSSSQQNSQAGSNKFGVDPASFQPTKEAEGQQDSSHASCSQQMKSPYSALSSDNPLLPCVEFIPPQVPSPARLVDGAQR